VASGIAAAAISTTTETVGASNAHVVILNAPGATHPDYKWQFIDGAGGAVRLLINRQDGSGWVQLVSQILAQPEYKKQQGPTNNWVWNAYGLNTVTTGSNVLQGWDRRPQADGSIQYVFTSQGSEEGVTETLTHTWTIPKDAEALARGPKASYSMTQNRGIVVDKGVREGQWRMKWALSGIADITADQSDIKQDDPLGNWAVFKRTYATSSSPWGFTIDVSDFDGNATSTPLHSYSHVGANNKAEIIFYKDGIEGARTVDPTSVATGIATAWGASKIRNVFFNGEYFFLLYTKAGGSIFYTADADNASSTKAANGGRDWSKPETAIISDQSTTITEFDTFLVDDTTFDIVYENSNAVIAVRTCFIRGSDITCNAGDTFGDTANSYAITRISTSTASFVYVVARDLKELEVWTSDTTSDVESAMVWKDEVALGQGNLTGSVSVVPFDNVNSVLVIWQEDAGGTASDGIFSCKISAGGGNCTKGEIGNLNDIGELSNAVRISTSTFRYLLKVNAAAAIQEYEYNGARNTWTQLDANIDDGSETDYLNPSLFYDRTNDEFYVFARDTGTAGDSIERFRKQGGGAWGTEVVVDLNAGETESEDRSMPVTMMHSVADQFGREPRVLPWAFRTADGSNFNLSVGHLVRSASTTQRAYAWFNDDGGPNGNNAASSTKRTGSATSTAIRGVERGERLIVRYQIDTASTTVGTTTRSDELEWQRSTANYGDWNAVSSTTEIAWAFLSSTFPGTCRSARMPLPVPAVSKSTTDR